MKPMMKCGHAANSMKLLKDGSKIPSCVICTGIVAGADEIETNNTPLEGRFSSCPYCKTCVPSSTDLAFFEFRPTSESDMHYCGCRGWD